MSKAKRFICGAGAVAAIIIGAAGPASATSIAFVATDLADVISGEDLWKYEYFVSGATFLADQGFTIFFDPALYESLQDPPPPVSPDWDILTLQPDVTLSSNGTYDALALIPNPSLAQPFSVSFRWLGGPATPGSQPFEVYELDQADRPVAFERGVTTPLGAPTVPEPSTIVLVGISSALALRRRRGSKRKAASSGDGSVWSLFRFPF